MTFCLQSVTKKYDNKTVLDGLDFCVSDVHSVGIIGESGCGKSTLLRLLAGIEDPDDGKILIDDISVVEQRQAFQNNIGYVFQKHNLFPHLTIEKNILLILQKIKKVPKIQAESIVASVLKRFHIESEAKKLPHQVSGGQAQRASIARALATNPQILFLDEPTAALDPILTNDVLSSVKDLKNTGVNFFFVTHEMHFLKEFCDYVLFLKDGKIWESGSVRCLENPKTKELKRFLQAKI